MLVIMLLIAAKQSELVYSKSAFCLGEQTGHQKCSNNVSALLSKPWQQEPVWDYAETK